MAGVSGSVTVTAQDASANTSTSYLGTIHFTSSDTGAGLPDDYTFVAADFGTHTFSNAVVLQTAGNQSVTATDTAAATVTGAQNVTVNPGAADHLDFGVQPSATTSGATISPSPTVRIEDAYGNLTTSTANVTLTLTGPAGATLSGTTPVAAVAGVASFNDLAVDHAGTYGLTASSATLTGTTSATFAVLAGPAQSLVVTGLADPTVAGVAGSVTVTARDASANTATSYLGTIHFTSSDIAAGLPDDYTFVTGDFGTHTFSNAVVLRTAGNQWVDATDPDTASITGAQNVTVTAAAADHLDFGVQPSATTSGATISPSPTVRIEDAYGNLTTSTADVSLALTGGPGVAGFSGTTPLAAVAGLASFNDLTVDRAGTYGLAASSGTLTGTTSTAFAVLAGPAQTLAVSGLAASMVAGVAGSVTVTALDGSGNTADLLPRDDPLHQQRPGR